MGRFLTTVLEKALLGLIVKEVAEMTAFSKYKGHISAQNTGLSILLTVCTKRLYLRDVCVQGRGEDNGRGKKRQIKPREAESRIQPESAYKESVF